MMQPIVDVAIQLDPETDIMITPILLDRTHGAPVTVTRAAWCHTLERAALQAYDQAFDELHRSRSEAVVQVTGILYCEGDYSEGVIETRVYRIACPMCGSTREIIGSKRADPCEKCQTSGRVGVAYQPGYGPARVSR